MKPFKVIAVVVVAVAMVAVAACGATGNRASDDSALSVNDSAEMAQLDAQMGSAAGDAVQDQIDAIQNQQGGQLLLEPVDAHAWIDVWNDMRQCAIEHGNDGVPEAPATFGDGETLPPVVVLTSENEAVLQACPFDTSRLDREAFEKASEAAGAHRPPASDPRIADPAPSLPPELLAQMELFMKANDPALYDSFPDSASRQQYIVEHFNDT